MPLFLLLIYYLANRTKAKYIKTNPLYAYYTKGLRAKIVGGFGVCLIYIFYYEGGDTIGYFQGAEMLNKMLFIKGSVYSSIMLGDLDKSYLSHFWADGLEFPNYYRDPQAFTVVRLASPLAIISGTSFFVTTLFFSWLSYAGVWKLFLLFNELFPNLEKKFAVSILYMPSVIFWGSGIFKDTITFSSACWLTYAIYMFFIKKEQRKKYFVILIVASYILISVKPYIFIALMPGTTIWIMFSRISQIRNTFIRALVSPAIIVVGLGLASSLMGALGSKLGEFGSVDKALAKATVTQKDLTRAEYGKNSFNIGEIDPSIGGMLKLFPIAVSYGLFGPFLWNATNIVMLGSAIENSYLLLLTLKVLLASGIIGFFGKIFTHPFLIFCFVFSIFFGFAIGLTTANFGALVRYKIPVIPFFLSLLYVVDYELKRNKMPTRVALSEIKEESPIKHHETTV